MTFLQIVLIIASLLFLVLTVDLRRRKKIGLITSIAFFIGAIGVLISSFNIQLLNDFSSKLGINRGAELVVYCCIIFLGFIFFHLMHKSQKDDESLTLLVSQLAINEAFQTAKSHMETWKNTTPKDNFIVHMRVYNESKNLANCIEEVIAYGFKKLIFINDGSKDNSLDILLQKQKEHHDCLFIICSHLINRGRGGGGAANKTGFSFIKQHYNLLQISHIITFDPDGQMLIEDTDKFMDAMENNPDSDIFVGSRFIKGGSTENIPAVRKFILKISSFVTRLFYGVRVSDPHIGYRIYSLNAMKQINLTADDMHYANEINEQIGQFHLKFVEVPVHIRYTEYSLHKGQKNSNSIKLGIEMLWKKFF